MIALVLQPYLALFSLRAWSLSGCVSAEELLGPDRKPDARQVINTNDAHAVTSAVIITWSIITIMSLA